MFVHGLAGQAEGPMRPIHHAVLRGWNTGCSAKRLAEEDTVVRSAIA